MARSIGVLATGRIWAGMVEDTTLGDVRTYPGDCEDEHLDLKSLPVDAIIGTIREHVAAAAAGRADRFGGRGISGDRARRHDRGIAESRTVEGAANARASRRGAAPGRPRRPGVRHERRRRAGRRGGGDARRPRPADPRLVSRATASASAALRTAKAFGRRAIRW